MESDILIFLKAIGWPGVAGLFVWFVLRPATLFLLGKYNNKPNNTKNGVNLKLGELDKAVNNEVRHDIEKLEDENKKLWAAVSNIQRDIAVIRDRLQIKQ
jgi:hypothetical protein